MFRRLAAWCVLVLSASLAAADPGPTLLTVFPPGAKAGETTEVTFSGGGFDGNEQLLFSNPKVKGESTSKAVAIDPKVKPAQPGMKGNQPTAAVKFKVTVPKDVSPGVLDVRVASKSGLSNPRAFAVGHLAEANEQEPNNDIGQAQKVELDTTVNGTIAAPTDVDYFSFRAKAGQTVVVYCLTTTLDSKLQADLMAVTPDGRTLAANRGYRDGDAVLDFQTPSDGEYLVRLAQFAYTTGGPDHFYRLTITTGRWDDAAFPPATPAGGAGAVFGRNVGDLDKSGRFIRPDGRPFETIKTLDKAHRDVPPGTLTTDRLVTPAAGMLDAVDSSNRGFDGNLLLLASGQVVLDNEKNDTPDTAQPVPVPSDIAGRIEKKNDRDWYVFDAKKGEVWTLEVFADRIGSPVDAFFILTDEKGKVIAEVDDSPDTLSPNQFYTKSDDPARYRFAVPADGKYKVMVSTREASVQFGVRDQYVLRIAKEKPDFRLAVMPVGTHFPDAGTLAKGGAVVFAVYVWRFDGFDGPIPLSAADLPPGVSCPPQLIGPGQTRGTLVLTAAPGAADWAGFVTIKGTATAGGEKLESAARPFSVVWPFPGVNPTQPPPNTPVITRKDRGVGLALAIRGEAPFALVPADDAPIKVKVGEKVEVALKLTRKDGFKDAVQVFSATPNIGPRQQGNNPLPPLATIAADKSEVKVSLDIPPTLLSGRYSLVLRGQPGAPQPKGPQARLAPSYPVVPVMIEVEGRATPKKR
ncbi:MAG: putative subtilase-type serine protease precursor [Gemmataceae bacterium]|nr:putative subtilase-type serine protease precursor [Gemmataceae bacterium]